MSINRVRTYLKTYHRDKDIKEFEVSSATVALAAKALGTEEARIAKTLGFMVGEQPILIVCAGDTKIDNRKYKDLFSQKAKMISRDQLFEKVGHEVGGVCPFAIYEGVQVYLDESIKRFQSVYPACGSSNSAIETTPEQLKEYTPGSIWIDVCKIKE